MGMNFSPMYQPVSTKTIKADGDLNINPYDLLATDVKCDTVEATEFVGGVGNFDTVNISPSPTTTNTGVTYYTQAAISLTNPSNSGTVDITLSTIPKFTSRNIGLFMVDNVSGSTVVNVNCTVYKAGYANYEDSITLYANGEQIGYTSFPNYESNVTKTIPLAIPIDLNVDTVITARLYGMWGVWAGRNCTLNINGFTVYLEP